MDKYKNLVGQKFNRLTVIELSEDYKPGKRFWKCKCDCGNVIYLDTARLTTGHTKSCGCLQTESRKNSRKIHGESKTKLYQIWRAMKQRCTQEKQISYHLYGGRGISVCKEWMDSYIVFRDWAISSGYVDGLTIDRIDSNKNYCPENCRWVTPKEQANNTRKNLRIEYKGQVKTLSEWCDYYGKNYHTVQCRLWRSRCSFETAMFREPHSGVKLS